LSSRLPPKSRIISFLHGLNYLHRSFIIPAGFALVVAMLATGITPGAVSFSTVPRLVLLCAALQLCEFYRQRFYLDWRNEWGLHWRVALLHFAKWPHMLLALCDVIFDRRLPYVLTPKAKSHGRNFSLLWPHALILVLLGTAWMVGKISGQVVHPLVQLGAALLGLFSVASILSEFRYFPPPYDGRLRPTDW
jgi:hypothetical protein